MHISEPVKKGLERLGISLQNASYTATKLRPILQQMLVETEVRRGSISAAVIIDASELILRFRLGVLDTADDMEPARSFIAELLDLAMDRGLWTQARREQYLEQMSATLRAIWVPHKLTLLEVNDIRGTERFFGKFIDLNKLQ